MPGAGRGNPVGDLRIGVDRIRSRAWLRRVFDGHRKNIAVDDRAFAREFFVEADGCDQLVEMSQICPGFCDAYWA